MQEIRDRIADALRSRLLPKGKVAVKDLAAGIDRSGEAIRLWLNGEAGIKAEDLAAVARYLRDPSLVGEVFGDIAAAPLEKRLWFTDTGARYEVRDSHAAFVRRHLGFPVTVTSDLAVYGMRNLGWCELTLTEGFAQLRYHAKGLKASAAAAARKWLLDHSDRIVSVSRAVLVGTEWIEANRLTVAAVAGELSIAAPAQKRLVYRKRLDLLPPNFGSIYRAWRSSPTDVMNAAGACGLGGRVNIFTADDCGSVTCQWLGSAVPVLPRECIGANVLAWSDPVYGAELRRAVLEAKKEEATFTELTFPLFGEIVHFDRLALDIDGAVVTITQRKESNIAELSR